LYRQLSGDVAALKKHAEGVIKAYAEGRQIVQWAVTELRNDQQQGLPNQTLAVLLREMTYGRKYLQWRQQDKLIATRLKQINLNLAT